MHMHFGLETFSSGFAVCIIYMVLHRSIVRSFSFFFLSVSRYYCSDSDSDSRLLLVLSYARSALFLVSSHLRLWLPPPAITLASSLPHCTLHTAPTRSVRSYTFHHISSIMMFVNDLTFHELSYFCVILPIPILLQSFFFFYRPGFAIIFQVVFFCHFSPSFTCYLHNSRTSFFE